MIKFKVFIISIFILFLIVGAVSAAEDINQTEVFSDSNHVKDIYVSDIGDDSNMGTENSSYATLNKAIGDIEAIDEATIHISKGFFDDDGNSDLKIDLNHKVYGGNLKIIGSGKDTIIDGQSAFRFITLGQNSNLTLRNLTLINFKSTNGGSIYSTGILTVENCIFNNSYVTGDKGGAIHAFGDESILTVKNSEFVSSSVHSGDQDLSNPQGGGAIFVNEIDEVYLENNTFINTKIAENTRTGVAVAIYQSKSTIMNNKFINLTGFENSFDAAIFIDGENAVIKSNIFINCSSPSTEYSIVYLCGGKYNLENNTFLNSSNDVGNIYANGFVENLNFEIDEKEITLGRSEVIDGFNLLINITDDMGNKVQPYYGGIFVNLISDNETISMNPIKMADKCLIRFNNIIPNGEYNLTITYKMIGEDLSSVSDVLSKVKVDYDDSPIDLWVSPNGLDSNTGTANNPLKTINQAIDIGFNSSLNVVIHLTEGVFKGEGNVALSNYNKGNLKIIGVYSKTIIDGENENYFIKAGKTTLLENLVFTNGYSSNSLIYGTFLSLKNCIIDNNAAENGIIIWDVSMENVIFTNNNGSIVIMENKNVSNSYFANNMADSELIDIYSKTIFENCKFINNTCANGVITAHDDLLSKNNYFDSNTGNKNGVFHIISSKLISENDTFINNKAGIYGIIGSNYRLFTGTYNFEDAKFINNSGKDAGCVGIKQGSFINCLFENNHGDYAGAIVILPIITNNEIDWSEIEFENNTFRNNQVDIYLNNTITNSHYERQIPNPINLTIKFNNAYITTLTDTLSAVVIGPNGAIINGGSIDYYLNDNFIGSSEILNGFSKLTYSGFKDGIYNLNGNSRYTSSNIESGTVNVNLNGISDFNEVWISNDGDDLTGTGMRTNPYKTISHTINEALKTSNNVIIHIAEGVYTDELNTNLTLSCNNNISIIGEGIDKTIIDGKNSSYLAKITAGSGKIIISQLTIQNMLPNNKESGNIFETSPITIEANANLCLDTVNINNCHGGVGIIENNGNLTLKNSIYAQNGYSTSGISGGNVLIDKVYFDTNLQEGKLINVKSIYMNNSEIKDSFNLEFDFTLIYSVDNILIENTEISNTGNTSEDLFGINKINGNKLIPFLSIVNRADITINNVTMTNNINYKDDDAAFIALGSRSYPESVSWNVPLNIHAYNSTFNNFQYIWITNGGWLREFESCIFNNFTAIAKSLTGSGNVVNIIRNSVFINDKISIDQVRRFGTTEDMLNIDFNNNYWASNEKPTIIFIDFDGEKEFIRDFKYTPDSWVILTNDSGKLSFKITDGQNITSYEQYFPAKISYVEDETGQIIQVLDIKGTGYKFDVVGENIILNTESPMYNIIPKIEVNETIIAEDISIIVNESAKFIVKFTNKWGDPLINTSVSYKIDDSVVNATTDDNGVISFDINFNVGSYTVTTTNPITNQQISNKIYVRATQSILIDGSKINYNYGEAYSAFFKTLTGEPLINTEVIFTVNGEEIKVSTDKNGYASFEIKSNLGTLSIFIFNPITGEKIENTIIVIKNDGTILADDISVTYNDGSKFSAEFLDKYGNPLININVVFIVDGINRSAITNEKGIAEISIDLNVGIHTIWIQNPITNEKINKTLTVNKIVTKLRSSDVSMIYNNPKGLIVTLADANGNVLNNQNIVIVLNGKTYNKITNNKGQVSLTVNLPVKAYDVSITYNGDNTHAKVVSKVKYIVTKATPKITAAKKSFKVKTKIKQYTITLKDNKGKVMMKVKVTLNVKGKTYKATTNAKGKATFKLTKLTKKGKYTAKVKFAGNKNFKAVTKSVKLTVK